MSGHSKLVKDPSELTVEDVAVLQEIDRKCRTRGLPGIGQDVRRFIDNFKLAAEGRDEPQNRGPGYPLMVDYTLEREPAIESGRFDWVDPEHLRGFTVSCHFFSLCNHPDGKKVDDVTVHLIHLDLPVTRSTAGWMLSRRGFEPIDLRELLALAAKYPDLQREFPIVALRSSFNRDGVYHTSFLCKDERGRTLDRHVGYMQGYYFHPDFRFAAMRIVPQDE